MYGFCNVKKFTLYCFCSVCNEYVISFSYGHHSRLSSHFINDFKECSYLVVKRPN